MLSDLLAARDKTPDTRSTGESADVLMAAVHWKSRGMETKVEVREANVGDAEGIARVLVDGWTITYKGLLSAEFLSSFSYETHEVGTRNHLSALPDTSAAFVAEAEGNVIGVAFAREPESGPSGFSAELDALYVLPSLQNRGVGGKLMLEVVRWLRTQKRESLFLWVLRDNPYRRFYDRLGGELLNEERLQTFGNERFATVAYGWRNLSVLTTQLEQESGR